jgi:outer membrane lipoprotein carrier protein
MSFSVLKRLSKQMNRIATFAATSLIAATLSAQQTPQLKQVADRVDNHYNHLASFRCDFTETYSGSGMNRQESGTLWLKKPGKMLWEYDQPHAKVFVSDGKTAYFYVPGEPQGRKAPLKKLDDLRSPLRYLLGQTKLLKEFDGLKLVSRSGEESVLEGVPKGMEDRIRNVRLTVQGQQLSGISIEQLDGSRTEFHFSHAQDNPPVADSRFKPAVSSEIQWIEGQDLAPE